MVDALFNVAGDGGHVAFHCPEDMRSHAMSVFRGEYDIPGLEFDNPPRILDVGANVGAFALWAMHRWPGATVTCFEPLAKAREYLIKNLRDIDAIRPVAVRERLIAQMSRPTMRVGKNNLGEASFYDLGEQTDERVDVQFMSVDDLPACDILKVDTEGCELEIIGNYFASERTRKPTAVLFEFHRESDRFALEDVLGTEGYALVRGNILRADRGTLCYRRRT